MGIPQQIKGRTLVVVEDIIDTGNTLEYLTKTYWQNNQKDLLC